LVTGLDLVRLQIEIAAGARLPFAQQDVTWRGSAIECRVYAEDPANGFLPSPGRVSRLKEPHGPGVRLDSGIYSGWSVPVDYDPLLAKLAVWASTRDAAVDRVLRALREYEIGGIRSNLAFFREVLQDPEFRAGQLHTGFLEEFFARHNAAGPASAEVRAAAVLAAALHAGKRNVKTTANPSGDLNGWVRSGRNDLLR
jgi:acetyl-CoA carboxylase biotin carboxylase subunit